MNEKENYNFIENIIVEDIKANNTRIHTRFPPEPNGYLHIGHAKAICINYGLAEKYNGKYNLRFDDTNPTKENTEYIEAIKKDIKWLGFNWEDREYYASDYFETLYNYATILIKKRKAYICFLSAEEIREYRGTLTQPGKNSPYRDSSVEKNLELFKKMRDCEFKDGECVLRAKIDMNSGNINMRDPVLYRILHAEHYKTKNKWCIYPTYDFTHGQSDSIEKITHSLCDISFEDHRPLYNWFIKELEIFPSKQIEFARLNITYTVLSKRYLRKLVEENIVESWDDPRMPTLSGMRRRGYLPTSIRDFIHRVGVSKKDSLVDIALFEKYIREDLNKISKRVMVVFNPLKVIIENYPHDKVEELDAVNNPEDEDMGSRKVKFSKVIYIEKEDFMENPQKKYFRLSPGKEVRLKHAYYIKCLEVIKDEKGEITELICSYDPETRGGWLKDGRKVKGTLHWVSKEHSINVELRLYDNLFTKENPLGFEDNLLESINPDSLKTIKNCIAEYSLINAVPQDKFQFLRKAYFCCDKDSTEDKLIFNRTISLRDTWEKIKKKIN